jgi:hypothetical protein
MGDVYMDVYALHLRAILRVTFARNRPSTVQTTSRENASRARYFRASRWRLISEASLPVF